MYIMFVDSYYFVIDLLSYLLALKTNTNATNNVGINKMTQKFAQCDKSRPTEKTPRQSNPT